MSYEEMRKAFEEYLRAKHGGHGADPITPWYLWVHGDKDHSYVYSQAEWEAWRAAIQKATAGENE